MNHPIQPLTPRQRLGWLKFYSRIRCAKSFANFRCGQLYTFTTKNIRIQSNDVRMLHDGGTKPVVVSGEELLVKIDDGTGEVHRFLATAATDVPLAHELDILLEHFEIPEIPDLAMMKPNEFAENQRRLRELES